MIFFGSPWQPWMGGWAFNAPEEELDDPDEPFLDSKFGLMLGAADVIVTHSPPAGFHDTVTGAHRGSIALNKHIERVDPRLCIYGHIHKPGVETGRQNDAVQRQLRRLRPAAQRTSHSGLRDLRQKKETDMDDDYCAGCDGINECYCADLYDDDHDGPLDSPYGDSESDHVWADLARSEQEPPELPANRKIEGVPDEMTRWAEEEGLI